MMRRNLAKALGSGFPFVPLVRKQVSTDAKHPCSIDPRTSRLFRLVPVLHTTTLNALNHIYKSRLGVSPFRFLLLFILLIFLFNYRPLSTFLFFFLFSFFFFFPLYSLVVHFIRTCSFLYNDIECQEQSFIQTILSFIPHLTLQSGTWVISSF